MPPWMRLSCNPKDQGTSGRCAQFNSSWLSAPPGNIPSQTRLAVPYALQGVTVLLNGLWTTRLTFKTAVPHPDFVQKVLVSLSPPATGYGHSPQVGEGPRSSGRAMLVRKQP